MILSALLCLALVITACGGSNSNSGSSSSNASGSGSSAGSDSGSNSGSSGSGQKKVVGVLVSDFNSQFLVYMMDSMKEEAKKYPDFEFVYVDAQYDSGIQMNQVENFLAQKVDALIYNPVDTEAAKPVVDMIEQAGIPLIAVNRKAPNTDNIEKYAYVGSNAVESGELLMEAMAEVLGGKGDIVELQGFYGHEPQIDRHQGILNVLEKYPDIKIIAEDSGEWNRELGMQKMENWLQSNLRGKFVGVVAHNDEMAIGAINALEDAGMLDQVAVGSIDGTPEALQLLKEGKLKATIFQDPFNQGSKSIEVAVKAVNGESIEREYIIPYLRVTPEEADQYLALYGVQ
jgi:inositol transport system substrate-binding protein